MVKHSHITTSKTRDNEPITVDYMYISNYIWQGVFFLMTFFEVHVAVLLKRIQIKFKVTPVIIIMYTDVLG
jgi:hypothetical protein